MALKSLVDDMMRKRGASERDLRILDAGLKRKLRSLGVLEENLDSEYERVMGAILASAGKAH